MSIIEMRDVVKNTTTERLLYAVFRSAFNRGICLHRRTFRSRKSTFIRSLYREVKIDKGSLSVAGFNLVKIKERCPASTS